MSNAVHPKQAATMLIVAGCLFLAGGVFGLVAGQFVFLSSLGVGSMFLALGATKLRKLKQPTP
jgi:hypothetical protein